MSLSLSLVSVFVAAAIASYLAAAAVCAVARRGLLLDVPNERSSHTRVTPRGGGIGIVLATLAGALWVHFMMTPLPLPLLGAAAVIAGLGFWDDNRPLPARFRLLVQMGAAVVVVASSGIGRSLVWPGLPEWAGPVAVGAGAVFFLVGLTNAYNFMDGIDGIAGLEGVVAGFGWAVLGWYTQNPLLLVLGGLLGASSFGFLGLNWHPARIFMGDVGSTFLGFLFGALTIEAAAQRAELGLAGVLLVYPFIFDTAFTFVRRLLRRERVFEPHRSHLFQRLVIAGLSHSVVAGFYGLLAALGAMVAFRLVSGGESDLAALAVIPAAGICLCLTVAGTTGSLHTMLDGMNLSQRALTRWIERLESITNVNRVGTWVIQAAVFGLAGYFAFALRFDLSIPSVYSQNMPLTIAVWVVVKSMVFRLHGLDRGWWRFISVHDIVLLAAGNLAGSLCSMVFIGALAAPSLPKSIVLIDFLLAFLATTGIRVATRIASDLLLAVRQTEPLKRVLVYGAGSMGANLVREIRGNSQLHFQVAGFVDDDVRKHGMVVMGARILGGADELPGLVQRHNIEEVLIAISTATGQEMTRIIRACTTSGVRCRTVPAMQDVIGSRNLTSQIRDVKVEDLLGRSPVKLDEAEIRAKIEGQVVLVTGAAGSIGSELCRQIARYRPKLIVGFDIAETGVFHLEREMRLRFPDVAFRPAIGSIQNRARLQELFAEIRPRTVYHAAAYKHVPLMEAHMVEAVQNNIFGTWNVAEAAAEAGVSDFVMISSDKAVHPTNLMGATKRVAELVVRGMNAPGTRFNSVRFGNVLGSNGSVVPLFKEQIAAGGPVTVTHPDMQRYFMTIPEAAQLVLQASTMGKGGDIFVLEMGQPVKIVDLARNLILLSGLQPDVDIRIEFSGTRPGEKLYEELNLLNESTVPTEHSKIKIFQSPRVDSYAMECHLEALGDYVRSGNMVDLLDRIKRIVPEYKASGFIETRAGSPQGRSAAAG